MNGEMRNTHKILFRILKGRDPFGDQGVCVRIILKCLRYKVSQW
jgi:hypothetical protein